MVCCDCKIDTIPPATATTAGNVLHLNKWKHSEDVDTSGIQHPHGPFMERAIYLSRVAGLEKRTGQLDQDDDQT